MEDEIWTTKDGRKIAVGDMDEQHVRNTLRMLLRNQRKLREQLDRRPGTTALMERWLRHVMRKVRDEEAVEEQRLHEDIMNEIGEDHRWGRD